MMAAPPPASAAPRPPPVDDPAAGLSVEASAALESAVKSMRNVRELERGVAHEGSWLKYSTVRYQARADAPVTLWEYCERARTPSAGVPDTVDVIPLDAARERIALILSYRAPINTLMLEFPGGLIDEKESVSHAAQRELLEETGLEGVVTECSGEVTIDGWKSTETGAFATATCADLTAGKACSSKQDLDSAEVIEVVRLPLRGLRQALERLQEAAKAKHGVQVACDARLYAFALGLEFSSLTQQVK